MRKYDKEIWLSRKRISSGERKQKSLGDETIAKGVIQGGELKKVPAG